MKNSLLNFSNCQRLVVVSDLHIRAVQTTEMESFLSLIQFLTKEIKPTHFVLNGDVFDFYLGSRGYFCKKFAPFWAALEDLAKESCQIAFVEGNHEFHLESLTLPFELHTTESGVLLHFSTGKTVGIQHGDLIAAPWHYKIFRKLVKSLWLHALSKLIPSRLFDAISLKLAHSSRSRDVYRTIDKERILEDAVRSFRESEFASCSAGVFGHFHEPFFTKIDGLELYSVNDWPTLPNALYCDESGWKRILRSGQDPWSVKSP